MVRNRQSGGRKYTAEEKPLAARHDPAKRIAIPRLDRKRQAVA
jgi:hypothetical protein